MSQSLTQIYLHIVFSTKGRRPFMHDESLRGQMHGYLVGTCDNLNCPSFRVGGTEDKKFALMDLIKELKRESSQWMKLQASDLADFYWQSGYAAFSISPAHVAGLTTYIADQIKHHREETFQDELRRLCAIYGVDLDERYAWD